MVGMNAKRKEDKERGAERERRRRIQREKKVT